MPLTERVDLSIALTVSDTCDTISLADTTPDYGDSGKIAKSDIVTNTIVVNMAGGIYFTYVLTITSGTTISASILSLNGATAVNILAELESTVWPFITDVNEFDLFGSYGVTLPEFVDGTYEVDYSVSGTSSATPFNYTTLAGKTVICSICCCVARMGQEIDPSCDCSDKKILNFLRADTYLQIAKFATQVGNTERAQLALDKANEICDCNDCGCN